MRLAKIAVPPHSLSLVRRIWSALAISHLVMWKGIAMAGGDAAGWSRWISDTSQMLILQLLIRTPSNMVIHIWAAEGLRRWNVGVREENVLGPVMADPNITAGSCTGRPVMEKIFDSLTKNHGCNKASLYPYYSCFLKPSALQMWNVQWCIALNPCIRWN